MNIDSLGKSLRRAIASGRSCLRFTKSRPVKMVSQAKDARDNEADSASKDFSPARLFITANIMKLVIFHSAVRNSC